MRHRRHGDVLVPFVTALVPEVDVEGGRVVLDPPGGLFDGTSETWTLSPVRVDVLTVFPDYLAPLRLSLIGRAVERGDIDLAVHDLRALHPRRAPHRRRLPVRRGRRDAHDPAAVGRGAGRRPRRGQGRAWARTPSRTCSSCRPPGTASTRPWPPAWPPSRGWCWPAGATRASTSGCSTTPRRRHRVTPVSIGDYVLAGGEAAALVVVEAVGRLLPGVLGNAASVVEESHADGLLEAPGVHPARALARASTCPRCSPAATTPRSPAGAATPRCAAPPSAVPTCSTGPRRSASTARTSPCCASSAGSRSTGCSTRVAED